MRQDQPSLEWRMMVKESGVVDWRRQETGSPPVFGKKYLSELKLSAKLKVEDALEAFTCPNSLSCRIRSGLF